MSCFCYYNAHPKGLIVPDCVKRAISVASKMDYKEVSKALNRYKKVTGADTFNSNSVNIRGNVILSAIDLTQTDGNKTEYIFTNLGNKINLSRDVKLSTSNNSNNYVKYNSQTGELTSYNNYLVRAVETTGKDETNVYVMTENESAGNRKLEGTLIVRLNPFS